MDALTILEKCKDAGINKVPKCSLVSDCSPPDPPSRKLTKAELSPQVKRYYVNCKRKAFDSKLQQFCLTHPIVIIHGLTETLKINLNNFLTRPLIKTNPSKRIEIREQVKYASDENWDRNHKKQIWRCSSQSSYMTMTEYANYQIQILLNDCLGQMTKEKKKQKKFKTKTVKFATNVDLNEKLWKLQFDELTKLPSFLKINWNNDMLTYVGHIILGVNTAQLYMKVPGCRTTGHQENNNFCSININAGPGDCEWFAVPYEYWGMIHSLCKNNGINYLHDSWWPPNLNVLHKNNVPVYRFLQKPGDIVWVNIGCVHWVHAIGSCNNVAWNIGPFTARQYELAIERYEWNKLQKYKSIVPMVHLSWRLARKIITISDQQLFHLIKNCLKQTMIYNYLTLEFLQNKGVKVEYDVRHQFKKRLSYYCQDCQAEVFNIAFLEEEEENKFIVYCIDCALKKSPSLKGFHCLKKYRMKKLMKIYDNFTIN
ncbi:PREDICTED: lysine-specific demethylase 6A-like [Cyphomyrmex costatus]|uniref:lysine-specific demethylase 6A-like n=1 Tax=Cyphomyrmex costatus TaxID=456900 RepID=UPI0008521FBD|nr:PREDICTED: lysine-specific demethylase 6A-like [Cyphomyrmex costatus]